MTVRANLRTVSVLLLGALSMAHVGSPDTFFAGMAGPYHVRVSVRLPGVIPGRAQVAVHVAEATSPADYRVTVRAGQWNVGLKGAPPPEPAAPVPGDATLYAAELWLMTPTSYLLAVDVTGPSGAGSVSVPVVALATDSGVTLAPASRSFCRVGGSARIWLISRLSRTITSGVT